MKLTATPDQEDLARLDRMADLIKADKRILVLRVPCNDADARRVSCNLPWLLDHLADLYNAAPGLAGLLPAKMFAMATDER